MRCEYNDEQEQDVMQVCRMEMLALEYEERDVVCLGRNLREEVRSASAGPVTSLKNWTQLWERMIKTRDNLCAVNNTWLCPGIAACGAVIAKLLIG